MVNYINELKNKLNHIKETLKNEKDEYKLIDLNNELEVHEDNINNAINIIIENYSKVELYDFAKNIFQRLN
jgi:hypothetical protein